MDYAPLRRPIWPYVAFLLAALLLTLVSAADADARGVHAGAAQVRSGSAHARSASHASNRTVNRNVDRNVNRNVNRDVDIDVDVDNGWDGHRSHAASRSVQGRRSRRRP